MARKKLEHRKVVMSFVVTEEIRDYLEKEYGMHDGSDYYVQPGAKYTDYVVEAIYEVGWDGQLIVREIEAMNI